MSENATERLRELLDERGVEWEEHLHTLAGSMAIQRETLWGKPIDNTNGRPIPHVYHCRATEMADGRLFLEAQLVTPEQAIEATFGQAEQTCSITDLDTGNVADYECREHIKHCESCHHDFGYVLYNEDGDVWMDEQPRYCPNCGEKVMGR